MHTFEIRVRLPGGGEQRLVIQAATREKAEAQAEAQTGGKVLAERQLPS